MKIIKYIFIIMFFISVCYSQVSLEWVQRFNGTSNLQDAGNTITLLPNGNVCTAGQTNTLPGNTNYLVIVYDQQGTTVWQQIYNGTGDSADIATAVAADNAGNVYVTGISGGSGTYRDFATIKYNTAGVQQWVQRYNGPGNGLDYATGIMTDNSGNVYVCGYSRISGTFEDYVLIKYSPDGVQQWVQRYNGPGGFGDWARGMDIDTNGNIYVTGESVGSGTSIDYCTVKYNPAGVLQWAARYHGTGNYYDFATAVKTDGSGNVYVTGYTFSGTVTEQDYCTIKYNSNGVQQWLATYNAPADSWEQAYYIALDGAGNVFVSGFAIGANSGTDYCTIKYNNSGVQQWVNTYNGPGNYIDEPDGLAADAMGNIYVTGTSYGSSTNYDICTIKYDNTGNTIWTQRYFNPGNVAESSNDLVLDNNSNVYITGYGFYTATNNDCLTLKYSQITGYESLTKNLPEEYILYQNYPNPFNPVTQIKFNIPSTTTKEEQKIQLVIFNSAGQVIESLVDKQLQAGTYNVKWNGTNYPSGIYFYTLSFNGKTINTRKMILLK
jgi:uncharacterized delta-60 repeat protein